MNVSSFFFTGGFQFFFNVKDWSWFCGESCSFFFRFFWLGFLTQKMTNRSRLFFVLFFIYFILTYRQLQIRIWKLFVGAGIATALVQLFLCCWSGACFHFECSACVLTFFFVEANHQRPSFFIFRRHRVVAIWAIKDEVRVSDCSSAHFLSFLPKKRRLVFAVLFSGFFYFLFRARG